MKDSLNVIAELNTSHFGNIERALAGCATAKEAGANSVKFQSWTPRSLFTKTYLESRTVEHRMYEKFSLTPNDLAILRRECRQLGIGFGSTAYSPSEARHLERIEADFIKVASMDVVSPTVIQAAAQTQLPTIISTGMASMTEIEEAVDDYFSAGGSLLTLLHCTSIYPTPLEDSSLGNVVLLQRKFPDIPIGYSDHTQGSSAAVAALGLGARVFEKHFSLDISKPGFDNTMAETQEGLASYVATLSAVENSLAQAEKKISSAEKAQAQIMRRSACFSSDIVKGEPLTLEVLEFKRPGHGLSYREALSMEGVKLKKDMKAGDLLEKKFLDL